MVESSRAYRKIPLNEASTLQTKQSDECNVGKLIGTELIETLLAAPVETLLASSTGQLLLNEKPDYLVARQKLYALPLSST